MKNFKTSVLGASLAFLTLAPLPSLAQSDYQRSTHPYPPTSCAKMEIVSAGNTLRPINFQQQLWIEGSAGQEYTVNITNRCPTRLLAIVSVDGLNVLNGQKASFDQTGYVVAPHSNTSITGWRKTSNNTAAFYFTYPGDSYGARVNKAENLGVIGAAFFLEKEYPRPQYNEYETSRSMPYPSSPMAPGAAAPSARGNFNADSSSLAKSEQSLGTGYGRDIDSRISKTEFERSTVQPIFTTQVRYESRDNLIRMGAIREPRYYNSRPSGPDAFPSEQYVPAPPPRRY